MNIPNLIKRGQVAQNIAEVDRALDFGAAPKITLVFEIPGDEPCIFILDPNLAEQEIEQKIYEVFSDALSSILPEFKAAYLEQLEALLNEAN